MHSMLGAKRGSRLLESWRFILALPALMLGGCSAVELVNALVPEDGFRLARDLAYGPGPRRRLDVYRPAGDGRLTPIVVFFYGGNWQAGARTDYLFVGEALARRGFIAVIPDYRLYPETRFPGFLEDAAASVRWALAHADELGGDPDRIHLMGHSAGAYIALMLTLDRRWLGPDRRRIRSAVGLAGPYDFLPLTDPVLQTIFAVDGDAATTQPIRWADASAPPVLLASGLLDLTVSPGNARRLASRIRETGGRVQERYYPHLGHASLLGAIARPLRFMAPVLDDVAGFMEGPTGG